MGSGWFGYWDLMSFMASSVVIGQWSYTALHGLRFLLPVWRPCSQALWYKAARWSDWIWSVSSSSPATVAKKALRACPKVSTCRANLGRDASQMTRCRHAFTSTPASANRWCMLANTVATLAELLSSSVERYVFDRKRKKRVVCGGQFDCRCRSTTSARRDSKSFWLMS